MSRFRSEGSVDHRIQMIDSDFYRLVWWVDRYYPGSRLRHPTRYTRDTDAAGARRFAEKWKLDMPTPPDTSGPPADGIAQGQNSPKTPEVLA